MSEKSDFEVVGGEAFSDFVPPWPFLLSHSRDAWGVRFPDASVLPFGHASVGESLWLSQPSNDNVASDAMGSKTSTHTHILTRLHKTCFAQGLPLAGRVIVCNSDASK